MRATKVIHNFVREGAGPPAGEQNEDMPESASPAVRFLAPSQVAELLSIEIDEVIALVLEGRLRGSQLGSPARWRVEAASLDEYLDEQSEVARRMALWHQSQAASFPEVWGSQSYSSGR